MDEDVNRNRKEGGEKCERRKGGELQQNKGWKWEVGIMRA